jgi:Holliday junction resolvase RusA-like endonuclease
MIEFEVLGEPCSKGRPRFRQMGTFYQVYTDEKTHNYENLVKLSFLNSGGTKIEGDVPLSVEIVFYMSIPKSVSKKKHVQMVNKEIRPLKKIDLDNGIKIILDALNKVAFNDDKQVVEIKSSKYYSENPRAEVKICVLENR